LVARLTVTYAAASGRDIKELLKLTSKFCKGKSQPLSEDAFAQCAAFRCIGQTPLKAEPCWICRFWVARCWGGFRFAPAASRIKTPCLRAGTTWALPKSATPC
jgi:hypothetical protein